MRPKVFRCRLSRRRRHCRRRHRCHHCSCRHCHRGLQRLRLRRARMLPMWSTIPTKCSARYPCHGRPHCRPHPRCHRACPILSLRHHRGRRRRRAALCGTPRAHCSSAPHARFPHTSARAAPLYRWRSPSCTDARSAPCRSLVRSTHGRYYARRARAPPARPPAPLRSPAASMRRGAWLPGLRRAHRRGCEHARNISRRIRAIVYT